MGDTDFINVGFAAGSRGLRNNNPMNVRPFAIIYDGQVDVDSGGEAVFQNVEYGLRAGAMELYINYVKHGFDTLAKTISDFAPSSDGNDTNAYISYVSQKTGFDPNAKFPLDKASLKKIMKAMIHQELGDKYAAYITDTMITDGIDLLPYPSLKVAGTSVMLILAIAAGVYFVSKRPG